MARTKSVEERVKGNEQFLTVMLSAANAAQRTHEREKLDALRAAVLNAALGHHEASQLVFISMAEQLTAAHLRLLRFLESEIEKLDDAMSAPHLVMLALKWEEALALAVANDLQSRGLIQTGGWELMSVNQLPSSKPTDFGRKFLDFITEPEPETAE